MPKQSLSTSSLKVSFLFYLSVRQKLIFEVFHEAKPPKLVGRAETSLGEIFGSPEHGLVRDLEANGKKQGKIVIRCEK